MHTYVYVYVYKALDFQFFVPSHWPNDDDSTSKHVAEVTDKLF